MHEERGREGEPGAESRERSGNGGPGDERASGGRRGFSDGIRHVNSVLSAFKEAVEESLQDARDRGDLSTERARELVHGALARAREAAGEARERLDLVPQREFEDLLKRVDDLQQRLAALERRSTDPARPDDGDRAEGPEGRETGGT